MAHSYVPADPPSRHLTKSGHEKMCRRQIYFGLLQSQFDSSSVPDAETHPTIWRKRMGTPFHQTCGALIALLPRNGLITKLRKQV